MLWGKVYNIDGEKEWVGFCEISPERGGSLPNKKTHVVKLQNFGGNQTLLIYLYE